MVTNSLSPSHYTHILSVIHWPKKEKTQTIFVWTDSIVILFIDIVIIVNYCDIVIFL